MKKRRLVIALFLVIATLTVSIGFATVSDTLTIIGNANVSADSANAEFANKVYFSAVDTSGMDVSKGDTASFSANDGTFAVHSLGAVDSYVTIVYTIKNDNDVDAKVTVPATKASGVANPSNSNETYFEVDYDIPAEGLTVAKDGGTATVTVTVKLIKQATVAQGGTFGVELKAESVDA